MKKNSKLLFFIFCLLITINANAQHIYPGDPTIDTAIFAFPPNDSLYRLTSMGSFKYTIDTTKMGLWEIGNTTKPFFTDSTDTIRGIMTDTLHDYPVNVNSSFVLKITPVAFDVYFLFRHKYQTTAGRDGGIVEISADSGTTWYNVIGDCNGDSTYDPQSILTDNFYGRNDTLVSGEPAFSGTSSGWQISKFQFFAGFPERRTGGGPRSCINSDEMLVRFRFKSDSTADSLAGWIISSITVKQDYYSGIPMINKPQTLKVFPNPSIDGVFHFPALDDEGKYSMEIFNATGDKVYLGNYKHDIDLGKYADGLYFYKVSNGPEYYRGQLIIR